MSRVFYNDLEFFVPSGVYMPREDSYLAADHLQQMDLDGQAFLDIGTGCGFLAIIAASQGADATGTDINDTALEVARGNARENDQDVAFLESDLFDSIDSRFDTITFNAPYLPGSREGRTDEELGWYGGEQGDELIRSFIDQAPDHLTPNGSLLLVLSSLTGIDSVKDHLDQHGFDPRIVQEQKVSWEKLAVIAADQT